MKQSQNTADKFINDNIQKYLFEEEAEIGNTLDNMIDYFNAEEKKTKTDIDTDNRLKSAQINPDERKIKDTNIKKNKERLAQIQKMKKDVEAQKAKSDAQAKVASQQKVAVTAKTGAGITENMAAPVIRRSFAEQAVQPVTSTPAVKPKHKKVVRVMFDKSTKAPFSVDFSERGFLVDGTRLSFEALETALSKEFNIVLNQGTGLVLDQVKMQKILKYKDRF